MQYDYEYREQIPVYANGLRDVPEAFRRHHWMVPVKFDQLLKLQLKVRMCCKKCEEKVKEEIWEVPGVFDVQVMRPKKLIVVAMPDPFGLDKKEVLRKAKKIDCRAEFVMLEDSKPQTGKPQSGKPQSGKPQTGTTQGGKPQGSVQQDGNTMAILPYHPSYSQSSSWPGEYGGPSKPRYKDDHVYYFHLLLLALFVFMLVYAMRLNKLTFRGCFHVVHNLEARAPRGLCR